MLGLVVVGVVFFRYSGEKIMELFDRLPPIADWIPLSVPFLVILFIDASKTSVFSTSGRSFWCKYTPKLQFYIMLEFFMITDPFQKS